MVVEKEDQWLKALRLKQDLDSFPAGTTKDMTLKTRGDPSVHDL